jgi:hypothetical protein
LGEVRERWRQPYGVPAHETVVGVGSDGKAHSTDPKTRRGRR